MPAVPSAPEDLMRTRTIPVEVYQTPLEKLELSPRTLNSLKNHGLQRVGQILEMTDDELKEIRNFGVKSLDELKERLKDIGYGLQEESGRARRGRTHGSDSRPLHRRGGSLQWLDTE